MLVNLNGICYIWVYSQQKVSREVKFSNLFGKRDRALLKDTFKYSSYVKSHNASGRVTKSQPFTSKYFNLRSLPIDSGKFDILLPLIVSFWRLLKLVNHSGNYLNKLLESEISFKEARRPISEGIKLSLLKKMLKETRFLSFESAVGIDLNWLAWRLQYCRSCKFPNSSGKV